MRSGQRFDLAMYGRAFVELAKHPSILLLPFIAAIIDVMVSITGTSVTDPLGGFGQSILRFFVQLIYGLAFGVAILQASNIWRGFRGSFDASWEEARKKTGGIMLAVVGVQFIAFAAQYIGGALLGVWLGFLVQYFLIYAIAAASIGGLPGGMAISGSIRAVRAQPLNAAILTIVTLLLTYGWPYALLYLSQFGFIASLGAVGFDLLRAILMALIYAYLAFPTAKAYDDVAFRGFY